MAIFCKHNYLNTQNSPDVIYCMHCGKVKQLPKVECKHKWKVHNEQVITRQAMRFGVPVGEGCDHNVQTLICESCGKIIYINLVTGERK